MKKVLILAAVALLAVVGCQNDIDNPSVKPVEKATLKASLEQPVAATRTSLDGELSVLWSAGDQIAVVGSSAPENAVVYDLVAGEGTNGGAFEGDAIADALKAAVYPASYFDTESMGEESSGTFYLPVVIPDVQEGVVGNMPNNANLAVAVGDGALEFKNVMGLLKLQLFGTAERPIKLIQIAANEPLAGKAVVTIDGNDPSLEFTDNITKVITVTLPENTVISADEANPTVVYAVVPAGAFASGLTVSVMSDQARELLSNNRTTVDNAVARSVIQEMPAAEVRFTFYKDQLANTYIVEPSAVIELGPFRPDGKLIGHVKSGGYNSPRYYTMISGQSPTGQEIKNYVNFCQFTAPANEGVRILEAKDADDNILWDWIIWITDKPEDVTLKDGKTVLMDRNLGAVCALPKDTVVSYGENWGLRFQFGRKDPVFNASTNLIDTSPEVGTIEYVMQHPAAFIHPLDTTLAEHQQWHGDWMWEGQLKLWDGPEKTIWDPCPAGYRVPEGGTNSFWATINFKNNALKEWDGNSTEDAAGYFADLRGYWFNVTADAEKPLFMPRGSYYSGNDGKAYTGGWYWCRNDVLMSAGYYRGRLFNVSYTTSGGNVVTNSSNGNRATGGFVRCQKIVTE